MSKPKRMQGKTPPDIADDQSPKGSSAILVALLTLAGTVLVALIGGYFGIYQAQIPIHATQTAEVRINTEIPRVLTEAAATMIAQTPVTPTLVAGTVNMAGGGQAPAAGAPDWTKLLTFDVNPGCPAPRLVISTADQIPDSPDPQPLVPLALKSFQAHQQKRFNEIAYTPIEVVSIISTTPGDFIQLGNSFLVSVNAHPAPQYADMASIVDACGGGDNRHNPRESSVRLDSQYLNYSQSLNYPDYDYYQLAPGEAAWFGLYYHCQNPGVYDVVLSVPFTYRGQSGAAELPTRIICPQAYSVWNYSYENLDWTPWPVNKPIFNGLKFSRQAVWDQEEARYRSH